MAEWSFPAPVEAARLSDELLGEAYEQTPASSRGWLKTTLAMTEALHGARPSARTVQTCNPAAGFEITSTAAMAPWALFLLGTHGASASRLASAIMTARLAGLEDIFAVCLAIPERPALLTALELTGVSCPDKGHPCHAAPDAERWKFRHWASALLRRSPPGNNSRASAGNLPARSGSPDCRSGRGGLGRGNHTQSPSGCPKSDGSPQQDSRFRY